MARSGQPLGRKVIGRGMKKGGLSVMHVIEKEGSYDDLYGEEDFTRCCRCLIVVMGFVLVFSMFCVIIWGASISLTELGLV